MNEQISNGDSTLKESIAQARDEVKDTAREAKDTIKTKTKEVVAQAREYGGEYVEHGKERAANRLGGFSESMRQTANRFEQEEDPNIARYTRLLANKLESAATYVRERDLNELRRDGENLVRQYPALFFGGMFVVGVVAARFLKASAHREEATEESDEGKNLGEGNFTGARHEAGPAREQEECDSCQSTPAL